MAAPGGRRRPRPRRPHVVLATGTASGKSLAYQLPTLTAIRASRGTRGERGASVLYLAPTKALAQDQLAGLLRLGLDVRVTTHDGDTRGEQRDWARDHGEYVLTNPDMLHHSLLPATLGGRISSARCEYVVIDECHHYRGRLRCPRRPRAAPPAAGLRAVRRRPDVRPRLGHRGRAGRDRRGG